MYSEIIKIRSIDGMLIESRTNKEPFVVGKEELDEDDLKEINELLDKKAFLLEDLSVLLEKIKQENSIDKREYGMKLNKLKQHINK